MFVLHTLERSDRGLEDATLSIGVIEPLSGRVYDLALRRVIVPENEDIVAIAHGGGAFFAPELRVETQQARLRANPKEAKPIPFRKRREIEDDFVTGYTAYAREAALYWREHGVGYQPVLAAGIFSLASIQTPIAQTLKLMAMLAPYVAEGRLPARNRLREMCVAAGVGFQDRRPAHFEEFAKYAHVISNTINEGKRDWRLRKILCKDVGLPTGLGLAKVSFTLALMGNNLGCLDARIVNWAYGEEADSFLQLIGKKKSKQDRLSEVPPYRTFEIVKQVEDVPASALVVKPVSDSSYDIYKEAERAILSRVPYYDSSDPVALARAQWMLWEQLGPSGAEEHDHAEMFAAVRDPRFTLSLQR